MLPDFRVRQRDYLLEIGRALTQELNLDKLLGRILNISIELLAGHAGLVALRTESGEWALSASHGMPAAFLRLLEPLLAELKPDDQDPENIGIPKVNRLLNELTYAASLGLLTGVGLPLAARGSVVGVIFIFRNYPGVFSNNDRTLLSSFASQAAIAVQNAQLYTQISHEKQRMDALLDSAADGILILNPARRIERCNPAFARMVGLPMNVIQNQPHEAIIHWQRSPQGMTLEQAEAGGWPLTAHAQLYVEGDLKREIMPPLPIAITYAPLLGPDEKLINVIATVRDITRFRQAEELKSTFISIISHELKTPVALIKGYVSTLRREDASWDREITADSLKVIEEEADRLTSLIDNLLDASRLQAGGINLKRTDVNLPEMARRLAKRFQTQSGRHTLIVDFPESFPVVLANEERIEQVLTNLISNALKYAPDGDIRISGQVHSYDVILCVRDQGPGIAAGDIPFIFERFYRSPDTARQTKGAGLGLYLARAIVEAHGGRIWIDTNQHLGAQICFSLPLNGEKDASATRAR
ncbi:MAG TPA: ATP-binding protein [Levilinea sp.]|nr:ATP-binding protein [Levilinea sp.]